MDRTGQVLRVFCANVRFRANDARERYRSTEPGEEATRHYVMWETLDATASSSEAALGIDNGG